MTAATPLGRLTLVPPPRRRALVVDDDHLAAQMLADALADRGFDAIVEHDGRSGFHRLVDELLGLDLVITDVVMPELDGETLIHTVRHLGGEHDLAIVAVSAHLTDERRSRLDAAGADAVLDKALGPTCVVDLALRACTEREMQHGHS